MYIGGGEHITLPNDLNTEERIRFCEDIIQNNPWYFQYVLPRNATDIAGKRVETRLSVMANYILYSIKPTKEEKKLIPTNYNTKYRNYTEIPFSSFFSDRVENYDNL